MVARPSTADRAARRLASRHLQQVPQRVAWSLERVFISLELVAGARSFASRKPVLSIF